MARQYFTPQARAAAAAARRKRAALKAETKNQLEVFVLMAQQPGQYVWQIRQFGAIVVETSSDSFGSQAAARRAGGDHLANRQEGPTTTIVFPERSHGRRPVEDPRA